MAEIEFTFSHPTKGTTVINIPLDEEMTGGQAFDDAAAQYKAMFSEWRPGHPDVTITVRGK